MITALPRIAIAVPDFSATLSLFRDGLGFAVVDISEASASDLGAKIAVCVPENGSNIEIMSPHDPQKALSQSLSRFLDRRGPGLFALMLESPDPNREAESLSRLGLKVLPLMEGAGGRDIHPSSTHGVLIRIYPDNSFERKLEKTDLDIGVSGITQVGIAVRDLDKAAEIYSGGLQMQLSKRGHRGHLGSNCVVLKPLKGAAVELTSIDGSKQTQEARWPGSPSQQEEGMKRLTLETFDLDFCYQSLVARGVDAIADNNKIHLDSALLGSAKLEIVAV